MHANLCGRLQHVERKLTNKQDRSAGPKWIWKMVCPLHHRCYQSSARKALHQEHMQETMYAGF